MKKVFELADLFRIKLASDNTIPLFVYGSLRRNGGDESHKMKGAKYVGPALTAPSYRLVPIQDFFGLASGYNSIEGELYMVSKPKLSELDNWELDIFSRSSIQLSDGTRAQAYMLNR